MKNISYGSCRNRCLYTILLIYHIIIRDNINYNDNIRNCFYVKTQYIVKLLIRYDNIIKISDVTVLEKSTFTIKAVLPLW